MTKMMENPIKTIMFYDLLTLSSIILAVVKRNINYSMFKSSEIGKGYVVRIMLSGHYYTNHKFSQVLEQTHGTSKIRPYQILVKTVTLWDA
jgi:hypothetical protein